MKLTWFATLLTIVLISTILNISLFAGISTGFGKLVLGFLGLLFNILKYALSLTSITTWRQSHFTLATITATSWLILTCISLLATIIFMAANIEHGNMSTFLELAVMFESLPYAILILKKGKGNEPQ